MLNQESVAPGPNMHQLPQLVVDQIECGLIVCDAHGGMLHANQSALRELEAGQFIKLKEGHLVGSDASANELASAIAAATQRRSRLVYVGAASQQLMLVVMPLKLSGADGSEDVLALVMIGRRDVCTPLGLELLAMQRGLTAAEKRVFCGLVAGLAVRDIAARDGVKMSTVRAQVSSIRDKLQAANIDELLRVAARVPPVRAYH